MTYSVLPQRDKLGVQNGQIYIDGTWSNGAVGETIDHIHPATNEKVVSLIDGSTEDVDRAVKAARKAFDEGPWPRMRARERQHYMRKIADLLVAHAEELSQIQSLDNGMPLQFSLSPRVSGKLAADLFEHFGGWIDKLTGEVYPQFTEGNDLQFLSVREPVGVVAGIIPWNAPLLQFPNKVAPALATGCTIVMKPSELASLTALRVSELISEAGLPEGVFNVVTGGPKTGDALIHHPGVDKVSFTGSRAVGQHILRVSGDDIKRVTLELGGKSAAIIFPDTPDLEVASKTAMSMVSTFLSGQVCSTTSRALVHKSIFDKFIQYAEQQVATVKFGNPFDLDTTSAPLISRKQQDKVKGFIQNGVDEGAKLVFGGDSPEGDLAHGNWVNPTLFADVDNSMTIAQEEIFGPVLSAIPFETEEEAIRIANDSPYGLSAGIYTGSIGRAFRVGKALRTGTVGINGYSFMPNSPFGGYKQSGLGREGGWAALQNVTELKTLIVNEAF